MIREASTGLLHLVGIIAALAAGLVVCAVFYQQIGARRDRRRFCVGGRLLKIDSGQSLYAVEKGSSDLDQTVLFESGIGATSLNWHTIQEGVAGFARTVAYDRSGLGWSDPCRRVPTPANVAEELHALLGSARLRPPYLLVGHSFGGLVMRCFALRYPEEVSGVVLVDPMRCQEWPPVNASRQAMVDRGVRLCDYAIWIARLGLARLAVTSMLCGSGRVSRWLTQVGGDGAHHVMRRVNEEVGKIPCAVWPAVAAHWSRPAFYVGLREHLRAIPDSVREMNEARPIRRIPVLVLTPEKSTPLSDECLLAIADNVRQIVVPNSAHWIHLDQPRIVIDCIRGMHEAVSREVPDNRPTYSFSPAEN
jgi:pimeloyl-ACP methyl ester carboxylesterase